MKVICIEEPAFFELVDKVMDYIKDIQLQEQTKWVLADQAMQILKIKSKTTLQKLRNEGLIRYSQPERRIILYDVKSLYEYLDAHAKAPFGLKSIRKRV